MQVDNRYLPPHRRKDVTLVSSTGGRLNVARTIALQRFFAHTNLATQLGVYNEPLPFVGG